MTTPHRVSARELALTKPDVFDCIADALVTASKDSTPHALVDITVSNAQRVIPRLARRCWAAEKIQQAAEEQLRNERERAVAAETRAWQEASKVTTLEAALRIAKAAVKPARTPKKKASK